MAAKASHSHRGTVTLGDSARVKPRTGAVGDERRRAVAVVWLTIAAMFLLASAVLLVVDRARRRGDPRQERELPPPAAEVDLFTPDALPKDPDE